MANPAHDLADALSTRALVAHAPAQRYQTATELAADGTSTETSDSLTEAPVEGLDFAFSIEKA